MAKILCLETATTNCSVCVASEGKVVSVREQNTTSYSHAEQLHVFINDVLHESHYNFSDLDAIAVSKGPGSYTGLRIGVSAAKGLCFSLDLPLISIPTLESMAHQIQLNKDELVIPVLDARRMEVYSSVFNHEHAEIRETKAQIIDETSFNEYLGYEKVHLIGNGAKKCEEVLKGNFDFKPMIFPSAQQMAVLAEKKFESKQFENVAYFEPFYLKDFILQGKKT